MDDTTNSIVRRSRNRLADDSITDDALFEYVQTAIDRICLRLAVETLPKAFESIAVDVVVKMHRRTFYEGIASESVDTLSTSFVNDLLDEYADEFQAYKDRKNNEDENGESLKVVQFL